LFFHFSILPKRSDSKQNLPKPRNRLISELPIQQRRFGAYKHSFVWVGLYARLRHNAPKAGAKGGIYGRHNGHRRISSQRRDHLFFFGVPLGTFSNDEKGTDEKTPEKSGASGTPEILAHDIQG
jgi:hypothetical protein